ncbi:MAG TPA: mechanosensitive ion channel domain-containing protein [Syntrophales bacterium]|nr:mechanosensitive ion channel domain-containing protein [Syntrophales bacterium]
MLFNRLVRDKISFHLAILLAIIAALTLSLLCSASYAKKLAVKSEAPTQFPAPFLAPVNFDNKTLFLVQARVLSFPPQERAKLIEERIKRLADNHLIQVDKITAFDGETTSDVIGGDLIIMSVTEEDAKAAGKKRSELAREYALILRNAIREQRQSYSMKAILTGIVLALLMTALFVLAAIFVKKFFVSGYALIESWKGVHIPAIKYQKLELIGSNKLGDILIRTARLMYFIVMLLGLYFYVALVLRFFPWTKNLSLQIIGYIITPLAMISDAFYSYMPNFFALAVIVLITRYGLKLVKFVFTAVGKETISFPGFYAEWAEPTYAIIRFLLISFAVVVAFPYMPGSNSPVFKGISIFIGVLLSLGSTSAVANVVAGVIITYMRAFKIGDRVKISEATGDILEKTLLITRLRTIKNEDITIPNSSVLGSHIINYSSSFASGLPLILHTGVTIGYDAPWRKVHELLLAAAGSTGGILNSPAPFVLQTALDDFYVHYELNAYTNEPAKMAIIYSELHQNIQDKFNEGGVEIMSPHYASLRDGNRTTIAEDHLPGIYTPPPFMVQQVKDEIHEKI